VQVLAPADPADHAAALPEEFGDQPLYIVAVGQEMAVGPVVGKDHIAAAVERSDHPHCAGLLPD
jgi:hypothetical protein